MSGVAQVKHNITLAGELAMQQATKGMTLKLDEAMLNINRTIITIFFQVGRYQHVLIDIETDLRINETTIPRTSTPIEERTIEEDDEEEEKNE